MAWAAHAVCRTVVGMTMRVCIWTMLPNHYQSSFHAALRAAHVDLEVGYYAKVGEDRLSLGWDSFETLPDGERYVPADRSAFDAVPDWRERVHVVPGFSVAFTRLLATQLSAMRVPWVHWSESSRPGPRWWATLPRKRWYARLVNRSALGAFGIGTMAMEDFVRWGVHRERVAFLPYSPPACDRLRSPDDDVSRFVAGRTAFVFVGALNHRKGIDVLLRAFADLGDRGTGSVLVLVGQDQSGGAYARQAEALGIGDRVLFRGTVRSDAIPSVLAAGTVFVLPSRFDGWGVVLNEAAAMGMPLIGSHLAGASHHLIQPGENGFHVKAGSAESLAAAMRAYASDGGLARLHGQRSLAVMQDFTAERNADRFVRTIQTWQAA